jgi:hypothetical protein
MAIKTCTCCDEPKDEKEFYSKGKSKSGKTRRESVCKICSKVYRKVIRAKPESRYVDFKRSAKRRNLSFELSFEEFLTFENKPCRYCGQGVYPMSLDRIDNDLGYVIDNVDSCCFRCNSLKHVFDEKEFLNHVVAIYEFQKSKMGLKDEQKSTGKRTIKKDSDDSKRVRSGRK